MRTVDKVAPSVPEAAAPQPVPVVHTRDGFTGDASPVLRPHPGYEYQHVSGPHAPHRLNLREAGGSGDPEALPIPLLRGRSGLTISVSVLSAPMPYVMRNVEAEELHFMQDGAVDFVTGFGTLRAQTGDFVHLAKSVSYRLEPVSKSSLRVVVETPQRIRIAPSLPIGIVSAASLVYPDPAKSSAQQGPVPLWLKSFDGITKLIKLSDPLTVLANLGGPPPVWKLRLEDIGQQTVVNGGTSPAQFAATTHNDTLFFNLRSRPGFRPPLHDNADYDEVVLYHRGPGAWGAVDEPGTLTWTPKGVLHWGAEEDVKDGFFAWLIECTDTLRLSDHAQKVAQLMETGQWGRLT